MGTNERGVRDGTGPYRDSYQNKQMPGIGRREAGGDACPMKPAQPPTPTTPAPSEK